jgi:hypothetical protein
MITKSSSDDLDDGPRILAFRRDGVVPPPADREPEEPSDTPPNVREVFWSGRSFAMRRSARLAA